MFARICSVLRLHQAITNLGTSFLTITELAITSHADRPKKGERGVQYRHDKEYIETLINQIFRGLLKPA
jgi:hypothetical protein